eukprot:3933052-Rhodomonas_salina.2
MSVSRVGVCTPAAWNPSTTPCVHHLGARARGRVRVRDAAGAPRGYVSGDPGAEVTEVIRGEHAVQTANIRRLSTGLRPRGRARRAFRQEEGGEQLRGAVKLSGEAPHVLCRVPFAHRDSRVRDIREQKPGAMLRDICVAVQRLLDDRRRVLPAESPVRKSASSAAFAAAASSCIASHDATSNTMTTWSAAASARRAPVPMR